MFLLPHCVRSSRQAGLRPAPQFVRHHHPDFDKMATQGWKALEAEGKLPAAKSAVMRQSTRFFLECTKVPPVFVIAACKRSVPTAVTG